RTEKDAFETKIKIGLCDAADADWYNVFYTCLICSNFFIQLPVGADYADTFMTRCIAGTLLCICTNDPIILKIYVRIGSSKLVRLEFLGVLLNKSVARYRILIIISGKERSPIINFYIELEKLHILNSPGCIEFMSTSIEHMIEAIGNLPKQIGVCVVLGSNFLFAYLIFDHHTVFGLH
ncbi:hypothetical protein ACJX0J_014515, partial [Zea mays]